MGFDCVTAVAGLFTTCAWALTLASTAWCSFVKRSVSYDGDTSGLSEKLVQFLFGSHGVGYWGWELGGSCFSYTINGQDPSFDTKYNTSRALTIVNCIIGGILMFFLWFSICMPVGRMAYYVVTVFLLMTCLFQGLTLLIFKSSICSAGFFGYSVPVQVQPDLNGISVDCGLSAGSRCSIAATALYFAATLPCCFRMTQPPEPSDDDEVSEDPAKELEEANEKKDDEVSEDPAKELEEANEKKVEAPAEEEVEQPKADVEA